MDAVSPSLESWQEALREGRSPRLREWVKQGHEPPEEVWKEASQNTWGRVGQHCFQALCSGHFTVPVDALEHATSRVYGWGQKTFARLLPKALSKDQWEPWLTSAWSRSNGPAVALLLQRRWSSKEVLDWLAWGVDNGWMSSETAVGWCCSRSEGLILPLPRLEEWQEKTGKSLALLAAAIQRHGGFFTPELRARQARLFTQASKPSLNDQDYHDQFLSFRASSGYSAPRKATPPPHWLASSVEWWGDFVVEHSAVGHPLKDVLLQHPACVETVFSSPAFAAVRRELARVCGLAVTTLPSDWWEQHGERFWSAPENLPVAQEWLVWHNVGSECVATASVVLQQLSKVEALELPVDKLLRHMFSAAGTTDIAATRKAWLELPQVLGWSPAAGHDAWRSVLGREWVQRSVSTAFKFQQALEEWESLTGEAVALPAPQGPACTPYKAWWSRRENHRQLDAVLHSPEPMARKPLRF